MMKSTNDGIMQRMKSNSNEIINDDYQMIKSSKNE